MLRDYDRTQACRIPRPEAVDFKRYAVCRLIKVFAAGSDPSAEADAEETARLSRAMAEIMRARLRVVAGGDGNKLNVESPPKPAVPPSRHSQKEDSAPVVGMGDHVPMFLLRPAKVKPEKAPEENDDPAKNTRMG